MFYKFLVWLVLAVSTVTGGAVLADSRTQIAPVPDRQEIIDLVTNAKSLQSMRPEIDLLLTVTPTEVYTPTLTMTPTPKDDGTPAPEVTATFDRRAKVCTRLTEREHPLAERIAGEFGVSIEEVIRRFCQGHGFGEIELAYAIAAKLGISVDEVFAKRDAGDGWGEIMKDYGITGNPKNESMNPWNDSNNPGNDSKHPWKDSNFPRPDRGKSRR